MSETNPISTDPRVSFFKKGAVGITGEEALNRVILRFAEKYFLENYGETSRRSVYRLMAEKDSIPGVNFKAIYIPTPERENDKQNKEKLVPNENQLAGLVEAARSVVENPIYKFKPEYIKYLSKNTLSLKFSGMLSNKNADNIDKPLIENFPSILISSPIKEGTITSHSLKQDLAKVAIHSLKKYLHELEGNNNGVRIALTGGTSIMRFVNKFLFELDEDLQFSTDMKKLFPINIVEIAEPAALESKGLLENSKSLYLALKDMELSKSENYIYFNNFKIKKEKLHVIYTGIGKAKDIYGRESNSSLVKKISDNFKKETIPDYLFEINAIAYYSDPKLNKKIRSKLDDSIIPIEELDSDYKIILCSGVEKRNAVYNLLLYCILNPKIKLCTHLILDHTLFNELVKMDFPTKNNSFVYLENA